MPITKLGGMTAGLQGGMALINNFEDIKTANLHREALSQQNAMSQLKLDEERKRQENLDRPIPISVLEAQISQQFPEWWKHAKETATGAKLIMTNSAGLEYTTPRNINTFMGMLNQQNDLVMASLKSMSVDLNNRIFQAQQAMQTAKKPEEQQAAAQQYKQLTEQLSSVVGAMISMDDRVRQQVAVAEAQKSERTPASRFVKYINPSDPSQSKDINIGAGETPPDGWEDFTVWKERRRSFGGGTGTGGGPKSKGVTTTKTPGVNFEKDTGRYFAIDENGNKDYLSSDQVQNVNRDFQGSLPTNDIKVMKQSAPAVLDLEAQTRTNLNGVMTGPISGRWREAWSGKFGAKDPQFRKLQTDIKLLITRLMKMHVGARGGQYVMEHFQSIIDAGKDDPRNMIAALDEIEMYANDAKGGHTAKPANDMDSFWKK